MADDPVSNSRSKARSPIVTGTLYFTGIFEYPGIWTTAYTGISPERVEPEMSFHFSWINGLIFCLGRGNGGGGGNRPRARKPAALAGDESTWLVESDERLSTKA